MIYYEEYEYKYNSIDFFILWVFVISSFCIIIDLEILFWVVLFGGLDGGIEGGIFLFDSN